MCVGIDGIKQHNIRPVVVKWVRMERNVITQITMPYTDFLIDDLMTLGDL